MLQYVFVSVLTLIGLLTTTTKTCASTYTPTQISQHNTPSDCWMVINGNVYDLTEFVPSHDTNLDIKPWCGKDATEAFDTKDGKDKPHSEKAENMLKEYLVGT